MVIVRSRVFVFDDVPWAFIVPFSTCMNDRSLPSAPRSPPWAHALPTHSSLAPACVSSLLRCSPPLCRAYRIACRCVCATALQCLRLSSTVHSPSWRVIDTDRSLTTANTALVPSETRTSCVFSGLPFSHALLAIACSHDSPRCIHMPLYISVCLRPAYPCPLPFSCSPLATCFPSSS